MSRVSYSLLNGSLDKRAAGNWGKIKRFGRSFVNTLKGENVNQAQQALDAGNKKYQGIIDKWKQNQKNIDALKSKADSWQEVKPLSFWDRAVNKVKGNEVYNWLNKVEVGESQSGKQNILDKVKMLQNKSGDLAQRVEHAKGKVQSLEEALASARSNTLATRLATGGVAAAVPGTYLASKALDSDKKKESQFPGSELWNKFKDDPDAQNAGIGAVLGGLTGAGLGYLTEGSGRGAALGGLAGAGFGGYSGYNYNKMFGDKSSAAACSPYLADKHAGLWQDIKRFGNLVTGKTFREARQTYSNITTPITRAISAGEARVATADGTLEALRQQKVQQLAQRGKLRMMLPKVPHNAPELQYRDLQTARAELDRIADAKRELLFKGGSSPVLDVDKGPGWFAGIYTEDPGVWNADKQVSLEGIYRQYLRWVQDLKGLPRNLAAQMPAKLKSGEVTMPYSFYLPTDEGKALAEYAAIMGSFGFEKLGFPGTGKFNTPLINSLLKKHYVPEVALSEMFGSGKAQLDHFRKFGVGPRTALPIKDMSAMLSGADNAQALSELAKLNQQAQKYKSVLADRNRITAGYDRYLKDQQKYNARIKKWDADMKAISDKLDQTNLEMEIVNNYKDQLIEQNKQWQNALDSERKIYNKVYSDTVNARARAIAGTLGTGVAGLGVYSALGGDSQ